MIKYDYTIERDEGDKTVHYKPDQIPKELSDLVYIQGPNSTGKSTLLNLIALGFFGEKLEEDELHPPLHDKLVRLRNSNYQRIKFNIEVQNEMMGTTIKTIKEKYENKDIKVREIINGKEKSISFNDFKKKYKLIYDIPLNPIQRMNELLKEFKNSQDYAEDEIKTLRQEINDSIKGIREGKNPKKIEENKARIKSLNVKFNKKSKEFEEQKEFLNKLKQYHYLNQYLQVLSLINQKNKEIKQIEQSQEKKKKKQKQLSTRTKNLISEVKGKINEIIKHYNEITKLLELLKIDGIENRYQIWKNINITNKLFPDIQPLEELKTETEYFIDYLKSKQKKEKETKIAAEADFLKSLYKLLNSFKNTNIDIPGTSKKISEFIYDIKKELQKKENIINRNENISDCILKLEDLYKIIDEAINKLRDFNKKESQYQENLKQETNSDLLNQLYEDLNSLNPQKEKYAQEIAKLDIEISKAEKIFEEINLDDSLQFYQAYTKKQLSDKIRSEELELNNKEKELERLNKDIEILSEENKKMENKKTHKYQNYSEELEKLRETVVKLEDKFHKEFHDHINKIRSKNIDVENITDKQKNYNEELSKYIAEKLRYITHIDKKYEIEKMDVVKDEILTKSGKIIRFDDLGSGEGQGAYLGGLIKMNDNRKIIALFDEVAVMDTSTLEPIFNKLIKLYNEKKLLLGIIVQKKDDVLEVKSLID
ncbi:MAG: hypothetical protein ACOCRX_08110 [Candidatus Woesearchaeota archaeon]